MVARVFYGNHYKMDECETTIRFQRTIHTLTLTIAEDYKIDDAHFEMYRELPLRSVDGAVTKKQDRNLDF